MSDFFAVEVKKRIEAQTDHTVNFVEAYCGSIAGVAETLESVQKGILDFGGYCICSEPSKLFLRNFPYYLAFGPKKSSDLKGVKVGALVPIWRGWSTSSQSRSSPPCQKDIWL